MNGGHGASSDLLWRVSGWDHHLHAFRELGDIYSEAVCKHTAQTSNLTDQAARMCHACSQIIGELAEQELAEQHDERDHWGL